MVWVRVRIRYILPSCFVKMFHVPLKCFKWWTKRNKLQLFARADYSEHWLGRVFVLVNDTVPR